MQPDDLASALAYIVVLSVLGLGPGYIAKQKGRSFFCGGYLESYFL